jgi:membrane peptidoglycan carboxypeptidase
MKNYQKIIEQLRHHVPGNEEHLGKRIGFWILAIGISCTLLGTITLAGLVGIISMTLPDVSDLENLSAAQSTEIYDRDDNLLYTIHGEENREFVPLADIAFDLQDATIAIEDDEFWTHSGVDIPGILKSVVSELGIGSPRGGSTITQQYIKNAFLSSQRSYIRKLKEWILALRLEREYEKEKILELYLNRIPYGNNAYGIQKAAEIYFAKDAKDLTLGESAILAALPQAPSRYNPFGNNKYSHLLKEFSAEELFLRKIESESDLEIEEYIRGCIGQTIELADNTSLYIPGRSDLVLKRMEELGYINNEERQEAVNEIQNIEFNEYRETIEHPHFVLYIKQQLEDKYGKDVVETGGLKVYTTINPDLQEQAEAIALSKGEYNESAFGANNVAVLSIEAKTGEILAMIGSRDYYNEDIDGNVNVVTRPRQPGSSFKPLVYAQAFYNSYSPASVIYDVPTKFGSDEPQNYDGKFNGQMSIRTALGQSRNIPAIKAYFLAGGQDYIIDLAEKLGITSLDKSHSYGYPLALGAGEVSLQEMVNAFAVFANEGKKPEIVSILKIENANGDIIEEYEPKDQKEVLDPQIAFLISDILSDESVKIGGYLSIDGHTLAAKTGTSTKANKKDTHGSVAPGDGWVIGYSPSVVTGVWVGNTDGAPMKLNANGHDTAGPIFKSIMSKALADFPNESFVEPKEIQHVSIATTSGLLPSANTPASFIKEEVFANFAVPTAIDQSFSRVKIDKISGKLANEYTPENAVQEVLFINHKPIAAYENWAIAIRTWYLANEPEKLPEQYYGAGIKIEFGYPPTEYDDIHTKEAAENQPEIIIIDPVANTKLEEGNFTAKINYSAPNGVDRVLYYIDGEFKFESKTAPYEGNLRISKFLSPGSRHLITAKIIDKLGYSAESAIEIKVEK